LENATGISHAKIILIGDHSVVYNQPAIALPLPAIKTTVSIAKRANHQQLFSSRYFSGSISEMPLDLTGNATLIKALLERFNAQDTGFELNIESDLPAERGMGSSAAAAVAITRAIYHFFDHSLSKKQLIDDANIAEHITHGNPSGIDVATTSSRNPVWFLHNQGSSELNLNLSGALVVADTGIQGQTSEAVNLVAEARRTDFDQTNAYIEKLGRLTTFARIAIEDNNLISLGDSLNEAQRLLVKLNVSHPKIDQLVKVALNNGALGAKLTGGGMGGCMICLADSVSSAVNLQSVLSNAGAINTWIQPFRSEELIK